MRRIITGLFKKRGDAERAVEHLVQELGIDPNNVEVHAEDIPEPRRPLSPEEHQAYGEGLSRGDIVVSAEVDEQRLERAMQALRECSAKTTLIRSGALHEDVTPDED